MTTRQRVLLGLAFLLLAAASGVAVLALEGLYPFLFAIAD